MDLPWWDSPIPAKKRHLPVCVDPMVLLNRLRSCNWPPEFDDAELKPDQERYGIISGIGNDAHFAPDYGIGLELGWGGLLAKIRR